MDKKIEFIEKKFHIYYNCENIYCDNKALDEDLTYSHYYGCRVCPECLRDIEEEYYIRKK